MVTTRTRTYTRRSPEAIAAIVALFERSRQTQSAFAERHDLSVSTLRSWLGRRGSRRGGRSHSRFVPVHLAEQAPATTRAALELELVSGRRLLVPLDADPEALARLLPVIVASC